MPGLWLRLGRREKLYPSPSCLEEGWSRGGGREEGVCVYVRERWGGGGESQDY